MNTEPKLADQRLISVDAWRGVAALGVLALHAMSFLWVFPREWNRLHPLTSFDVMGWFGWLLMPLRAGGLGVQLFFVLSGYCIHRSQAKALASNPGRWPMQTWRFYARRFLRIYPTYVAAMVFVYLARFVLLPYLATKGFTLVPEETAEHHTWQTVWVNLVAMQNVLPPPTDVGYQPAAPFEWVYWTLALEIHYYLLYPLVLKIIQKYGAINMLILALVAGVVWTVANMMFGKYGWPCFCVRITWFAQFWFTWCIGAYIAELDAERAGPYRRILWWAAGGSVLAILLSVGQRRAPDAMKPVFAGAWEFAVAVAIAAVLLWSLEPSRLRWWRSWPVRALAFVGIFSYSLYALHYTCLRVIRAIVGPAHENPLWVIGASAVIVVVAFVFFQLVERWTLKAPAWLKDKRRDRAALESAAAP